MILLFSWDFDPIVFCEEGRLTVDYHKAWLIVRVPGCQKLQMTAYLSLVPTHMATVGIKNVKTTAHQRVTIYTLYSRR